MEVVLLGTGAADGWPNPFCRCASCEWSRTAGVVRGQTAALVDDVLLLDCGPEAPRAAARAGRRLDDVRHLLLTHAHPDHVGPAALLFRTWARVEAPLDVWGPEAVLDLCRDWVDPAGSVAFHEVGPGDALVLATDRGDYTMRALPAAHGSSAHGVDPMAAGAVLYDVTAPDGGRLLYATDTGPLPAAALTAAAGAAYDLVLLEETFGDLADHGTGHLDLATFPRVLGDLRSVGAVAAGTDVVAVHLSHHNPPGAELDRRLAAWGARTVPDLTVLGTGRGATRPTPPPDRRVLVLGGARSGKSAEAERRLADRPDVVYVATGGTRPDDAEWADRVAAHRRRRPPSWRTVETTDVAGLLRHEPGPLLVDCLSLWLTARLDDADAWSTDPLRQAAATTKVEADIDDLVDAVRHRRGPVVLVSNEVGLGVVPPTAAGRLFRDLLGRLNSAVADACDQTLLMVAGRPVALGREGT